MGRILRNAEAGYVQSCPGRRTFRAHLIKTAAEGTAIRREGDAGDGQPLISDTVYGTLVPNCTTAVLESLRHSPVPRGSGGQNSSS
jgi:hypothetical protein